MSPIGLVASSSYIDSIVPPAPDDAPDIVPVSLNPTLNDSLLIPTSPVPSLLLLNLYTWPFATPDEETVPNVVRVPVTPDTFASPWLGSPNDIAFTVALVKMVLILKYWKLLNRLHLFLLLSF